MKFLVPNYSCLQNPWLGGYHPQIPVLSVLCPQLNLLNPPPPREQNSWVRHWVSFELTNWATRSLCTDTAAAKSFFFSFWSDTTIVTLFQIKTVWIAVWHLQQYVNITFKLGVTYVLEAPYILEAAGYQIQLFLSCRAHVTLNIQ